MTFLWNSEQDGKPFPIEKSAFVTMLDEQNGVMIVAAYQETSAHITELLFFGPDGEENAQRWSDYAEWSTEPNHNTETAEAIRDCFSLPSK